MERCLEEDGPNRSGRPSNAPEGGGMGYGGYLQYTHPNVSPLLSPGISARPSLPKPPDQTGTLLLTTQPHRILQLDVLEDDLPLALVDRDAGVRVVELDQVGDRVKLLLDKKPVLDAATAVVRRRDQTGPQLVGLGRDRDRERVAARLRRRVAHAKRACGLALEKRDHVATAELRSVPEWMDQPSCIGHNTGLQAPVRPSQRAISNEHLAFSI